MYLLRALLAALRRRLLRALAAEAWRSEEPQTRPVVTDDGTASKIAALVALQQSDIQHNVSSGNSILGIVGISFTYLSVTSLSLQNLNEVPIYIFCWLALPLLFLQIFQLLLTSAVVRRAHSARQFEIQLLLEAGADPEASNLGTATSDSVMDLGKLLRTKDGDALTRTLRIALLAVAYAGFYVLSLGYTVYVWLTTYRVHPGHVARDNVAIFWSVASLVVYVLLWLLFLAGAVYYLLGLLGSSRDGFKRAETIANGTAPREWSRKAL